MEVREGACRYLGENVPSRVNRKCKGPGGAYPIYWRQKQRCQSGCNRMSKASSHIISVFKVNSCPWHITLSCFWVYFKVQTLNRSITALGFAAATFFSTTHKSHRSHTYIHYSGSEPAFQPPMLDNSWKAERSSESIKYPAYTFQKESTQCMFDEWHF